MPRLFAARVESILYPRLQKPQPPGVPYTPETRPRLLPLLRLRSLVTLKTILTPRAWCKETPVSITSAGNGNTDIKPTHTPQFQPQPLSNKTDLPFPVSFRYPEKAVRTRNHIGPQWVPSDTSDSQTGLPGTPKGKKRGRMKLSPIKAP
jgi:hypothetical protein